MSFQAKYHGTCAECEEHISPGEIVEYRDDGLAHDRHEAPRERPICGTCHMMKPCDCEE